MNKKYLSLIAPIVVFIALIFFWEISINLTNTPHYIVPRPSLVAKTLFNEFHTLFPALIVTLYVTILALLLAVVLGVIVAILIFQFKIVEISLMPYAIILQVTPVIAIAPLIIILVDNTFFAALICAWLVSFFPILSSTLIGLKSVDHNLDDLFKLYKTNRIQKLFFLQLPSALPYFLSGFKISAGLSLIGAIVAEFVTGIGGSSSGLAYIIIESSYRLEIPKMFSALVLIALTGVGIFLIVNLISYIVLRKWHESEKIKEY
ncbi:MAG: putative aliphatic sulfonates transport permease protein SsuC [Alphaproteobacteria bacterium MarineAlpha5_Bin11]|nr:MAG: putative aliphatic sulfonates transport permease protein SsuC [Alphaproteobacteria bacterium MarineAlpha5_Bin11]|tara:strand:- start:413 stop:1198 length:786 start_codon:yes stop_codon:yes gene_type:complete